jgi:hypothetical protein
LTEPYSKVIYYYGYVKVVPEGNLNKLAYQYTLWDTACFTKGQLTGSAAFNTRIGDVLVSIIADEHGKGEYVSPRVNDPEELSL